MLHIEIVEDFSRFLDMKGAWQALEREDDDAHIFLSWAWLSRIFRDNPGQWRVIAVRDGLQGGTLAILPLRVAVEWTGTEFVTRMDSATTLLGGAPASFLCRSSDEGLAAQGLAEALSNMAWAHLSLEAQEGNARMRRLARALGSRDTRIALRRAETHALRLELPEDPHAPVFAAEAEARLDSLKAQHLGKGGWRVRVSRDETRSEDIAELLALATADAAAQTALEARVAHADLTGDVMVQTLREDDRLLGGILHVCDHEANVVRVLAEIVPEDDAAHLLLLRGASAGWAARHGFTYYAFGAGESVVDGSEVGAERVIRTALHAERAADAPRFDHAHAPLAMVRLAEMVQTGEAGASAAARALSLGSA